MRRILGIIVIGIAGFICLSDYCHLYASSITVRNSLIVFDNDFVRYEVHMTGHSHRLVERNSGIDYLDHNSMQPFMYVKKDGKEYSSSKVMFEGDRLIVEFGEAEVTGSIQVLARDNCFIFELIDLKGQNIEEFGLARLRLTITEHIGAILNIAYNENFGVCLLRLNIKTHAEGQSGSKAVLGVSCVPRFGMLGAKFAFIGVLIRDMLPMIGKLEIEYGLPHPTLDGEWDKVSRAVETSYLFTDGNQANIDSCIAYAKAGGYSYLMLLGGCFTSYGHYEINKKMFPDSMNGLKATFKKIHDAGLKGGIHFLAAWLSKDDPYVTPVPDNRIAKDGEFLLAKDVSDDDDFIATVESPSGFPEEPELYNSGCELIVGNEIIRYTGLSTSPPYGFKNCRRGMYGTKAESHDRGDKVYHILEVYMESYMVDPDTDLLDELGARMGKIFNEAEIDMVYFDGGETVSFFGPGWYYVGKAREAYYKNFKREVFLKGSGLSAFSWHVHSQGTTNDWVALAVKRWLDWHKALTVQSYHDNLMPAELGWWGYFTHSPSVDASLPDEVEYGYSKGGGYDSPTGFETHLGNLAGNGRTGEVLAMVKRWEELRLSGTLSDNMKKELRTPEQEHTLLQDDSGNWNIHRITYEPEHYVKAHVQSTLNWKYTNQYGDQPLRLRIKAKCHHADYGNSHNIAMTNFDMIKDFRSRTASPELTINISVSSEQAKGDSRSWKITAANTADSKSAWAELEYRYDRSLNLEKHRSFGVWVWGDGSGAILNICPVTPEGVFRREHCIDLDFKGWKYCELTEPTIERVYKHKWPYGVKWSTRDLNYGNIGRIMIYINEVPANSSVTCHISNVEALAELPTIINNPAIKVNGTTLTFPVILHDEELLEYQGTGTAKIYDKNNFVLRDVQPSGNAMVAAGNNDVSFSCRQEGKSCRARITIITLGEALKL